MDQLYCYLRRWRRRAADFGRKTLLRGMDQVFPAHCPVTEERIATDGALSGSGWQKLSFISAPLCDLCGSPFETFPLGTNSQSTPDLQSGSLPRQSLICAACSLRGLNPHGSHRTLVSHDGVDQARAALIYDDTAAPLILKLKYADRHDLVRPLSMMMMRAAQDLLQNRTLIIAPVPLHRARLRARRFNQAALLGRFIAGQAGQRYIPDLLIRHRKTPPQKGLPMKARIRNVSAAFHIHEKHRATTKNARILLIDDVLTTGATVTACARVLKNAGARNVSVLTIARVVDHPLAPE